jgi:hypothetical protein
MLDYHEQRQRELEARLRVLEAENERLRAALEKLVQTSLTAYHESEAAIATAKAWHDALAAARATLKDQK